MWNISSSHIKENAVMFILDKNEGINAVDRIMATVAVPNMDTLTIKEIRDAGKITLLAALKEACDADFSKTDDKALDPS